MDPQQSRDLTLHGNSGAELRRCRFSRIREPVSRCSTMADFVRESHKNRQSGEFAKLSELLRFSQVHWLRAKRESGYDDLDCLLGTAKKLVSPKNIVFGLYDRSDDSLLSWARLVKTPNRFTHANPQLLRSLQHALPSENRNFYYVGPLVSDPHAYRVLSSGRDPTIELLEALYQEANGANLVTRIAEKNIRSIQTFERAGFKPTANQIEINGVKFRWYAGNEESYRGSERYLEYVGRKTRAEATLEQLQIPIRDEGGLILVAGSREEVVDIARSIAMLRPKRGVLCLIETKDENVYQDLDSDTRRPRPHSNIHFVAMNVDFRFFLDDVLKGPTSLTRLYPGSEAAREYKAALNEFTSELLPHKSFETVIAQSRQTINGYQFPYQYYDNVAAGGQMVGFYREEGLIRLVKGP